MATIIKNKEVSSYDDDWKNTLKSRKVLVEAVENLADITNANAISVGPLNKLQRFELVNHRANNPGEKVVIDRNVPNNGTIQVSRENKKNNYIRLKRPYYAKDGDLLITSPTLSKRVITDINNTIVILNKTVSPYVYLTIQNTPQELEVEPEAAWAVLKSAGRNSPFLFYTGSEDKINLDITWFNTGSNREEVLNKCRLLESWTKADGYSKSPPVLEIIWGNSNMFFNHKFVLESAPYKLSNFQNAYNKGNRVNPDIVDLKLLPNTAEQKLSFIRISTTNLKHEDIIAIEKLKLTKGVEIK